MLTVTIHDFMMLEKFTKKYAIKAYVSSTNEDGTFIIKDETASVSLEIEEGAEAANELIIPGNYLRLVNPCKISDVRISMPKKSSSSLTKPFSMGENVSPVKNKINTENSDEDETKLIDYLMEPLLSAGTEQVVARFIVKMVQNKGRRWTDCETPSQYDLWLARDANGVKRYISDFKGKTSHLEEGQVVEIYNAKLGRNGLSFSLGYRSKCQVVDAIQISNFFRRFEIYDETVIGEITGLKGLSTFLSCSNCKAAFNNYDVKCKVCRILTPIGEETFRYDLIVDVDGMTEPYIVGGFKPALIPILPPNHKDCTQEALGDILIGKKVKLFVIIKENSRDTIHSIEEFQD